MARWGRLSNACEVNANSRLGNVNFYNSTYMLSHLLIKLSEKLEDA